MPVRGVGGSSEGGPQKPGAEQPRGAALPQGVGRKKSRRKIWGKIRLPWRSQSSGLIEQRARQPLVSRCCSRPWQLGPRAGVTLAACRLRDFGGGGRFEVQLCPVSRGSCRTAEQRKSTGVLWHFADGLGVAGLEMDGNGNGNGNGRRCDESRVCRVCKPNRVCTVSRRSGGRSAVVSTVSRGSMAAVDGNNGKAGDGGG